MKPNGSDKGRQQYSRLSYYQLLLFTNNEKMGVQKYVYTMHVKQLSKRSIQNKMRYKWYRELNTKRKNAKSKQYRKNQAENKLQNLKIGVTFGAGYRTSHSHKIQLWTENCGP